MSIPFSGGCACGAIRYTSIAGPLIMANCHCRDCQRSSGTGFSSVVVVPADAVSIDGDEPVYHATQLSNGNRVERGFCAACGSPLFSRNAFAAHILSIKAGSLDDPSWFRPMANLWVASAQPWTVMDPELPRFEQMPPLG